jgi:hypothetical protein
MLGSSALKGNKTAEVAEAPRYLHHKDREENVCNDMEKMNCSIY